MSVAAAEAKSEPQAMNAVRAKFFTLHSKTKNDRVFTCNQCEKQMRGSARIIRNHVLGDGEDSCPCPDFEAVEMCKAIELPAPRERAAKKKQKEAIPAAAPAPVEEPVSSPTTDGAAKKKKKNNKKKGKAARGGTVRVAATQMACSDNLDANLRRAEVLVREAAKQGAKIILLQELFHGLYFCQEQDSKYFKLASVYSPENPFLRHFANLARELDVVLPISFYENKNNVYYNSIVIIDATGEFLGIYRKSHIPDGPGYQEKFYFTPGDTGFQVFQTKYAKIGVAICWDQVSCKQLVMMLISQWFPEAARCMALQGAEILFYPTAIGSEPQDASLNSRDHWTRTMVGHSAGNMVPVVASNRIGTETFKNSHITFYGGSFITGNTGEMLAQTDERNECVLVADLDLDRFRLERQAWGMFRDRRPELYGAILTKDGQNKVAGF